MEAGRPGAKLDYFDDDNLYNQVIGRVSGMAAWPLPSRLRRISSLSGQQADPEAPPTQPAGLFQIHHKELNGGCEEKEFRNLKQLLAS